MVATDCRLINNMEDWTGMLDLHETEKATKLKNANAVTLTGDNWTWATKVIS